MKKLVPIITVIIITAALCLTLAACNNVTTQGTLENPLSYDHKYETFVYDVTDTYSGKTGTYTVRLAAYESGSTVEGFGNRTLENVAEGILVTGELEFDGDRSTTGCYFKLVGSSTTYMVPTDSYTVHYLKGTESFRLQATYGGKNAFEYERTVLGKTDSGSLKVSGTYFDNNEFHQMLRTVSSYSSGLTLAFKMPLVTEKEAQTLDITAVASANTVKISTPFTASLTQTDDDGNLKYADGMDCHTVTISRSTLVAGTSQTLYYAVDNVSVNPAHPDVRALRNILLKIVEPYKVDGKATFSVEENGNQVEKTIQMEYTLRQAAPELL